jgi:hypothetical protein
MLSHIIRKRYVFSLDGCADHVELPTVDKRTKAICLTNMAQCHIKIEEFGKGRSDMEIDSKEPQYKMPRMHSKRIRPFTKFLLVAAARLTQGLLSSGDGQHGNSETQISSEGFSNHGQSSTWEQGRT